MNETTPAADDTPAPDAQRLARDMRKVVEDAEALLRHKVRDAGDGYAEARIRLEDSLKSAKDRIVALEQELADRVTDAGRATDRYVRDHPWESIGIGAAVGLALGVLIARR
jgi:ElaB/YqjD/DUF883 family membrane-anchored ribosome-binding protein